MAGSHLRDDRCRSEPDERVVPILQDHGSLGADSEFHGNPDRRFARVLPPLGPSRRDHVRHDPDDATRARAARHPAGANMSIAATMRMPFASRDPRVLPSTSNHRADGRALAVLTQ